MMIYRLTANGMWDDFQDVVVQGCFRRSSLTLYRVGIEVPAVSMPDDWLVVDLVGREAMQGLGVEFVPIKKLCRGEIGMVIDYDKENVEAVVAHLSRRYAGDEAEDLIMAAAMVGTGSSVAHVDDPALWAVVSSCDGVAVERDAGGRMRVTAFPGGVGVRSVPWLYENCLLFDEVARARLSAVALPQLIAWRSV